jgi:hypothetical protein
VIQFVCAQIPEIGPVIPPQKVLIHFGEAAQNPARGWDRFRASNNGTGTANRSIGADIVRTGEDGRDAKVDT